MTEAELVAALRRPARRERCVCGAELVARSAEDPDVLDAIVAHNRTRDHVVWRAATGGLVVTR